MRRLFTLGLAVWLVSAGLFVFGPQSSVAQDGFILGEPPHLQDGATVTASGTDIVAAASVPAVDTSSRAASASFFYSYYNAEPDIGWTGSHASCNAGTTSAAFKSAVIDRIAFYRAMAGVPSAIGLSATSSAADQQAALMFSRNSQLSHSPPPSWVCYTATGANAAANSNIALGVYGTSAIDAYMRDPGSGNTAVGHRRWILYPQTQSFGTGDVPWASGYSASNALWAWDENVVGPRPSTRDGFVAWPPSGYVPYQVVYGRWSFSYPNAGFGSTSVTVTLNGVNVPISIDSTTATGYGENTIVFRPYGYGDGYTWTNPGTDKTFRVTIAGVNDGGQSRTFVYDVTVFDPASAPPPTTPTATPTSTHTPSLTPTPSRTPTGAPPTATNSPTNTPTVIPGGFAPGDLFKTTVNLNMRSGPGTSYSTVATLPNGTMGEVTGPPVFANGYTWYPVTVGGYGSGWAASEFFQYVGPTATPAPTQIPTATRTPTQGPPPPTATSTSAAATRIPGGFLPGDIVRTTARVNFRSGPGTNYSVIGVASYGTYATITGSPVFNINYDWYPMTIDGMGTGWIASNYLELVAMAGGQPTSTPTPLGGFGVGETVYTTVNLNIRTGPGTGYPVIGVAPAGTSAIVTGTASKVGNIYWFPLDVSGIGNGWASSTYLASSPSVQGPRYPGLIDPNDEIPVTDAALAEELAPASPTPTVVDLITPTTAPAATATTQPVEAPQPDTAASPVAEIEDSGPAELGDAPSAQPDETLAAEPTAEPAPAWLTIERVQRSPDSQPGQTLVDDDPATVWFANGVGQPLAMFVLDLGQETAVSQIRWLAGDAGLSGELYLSISSDGEQWIDLDPTLTVVTEDGWSQLDTPATARYVRVVFVNANSAEWLGGIAEIRIMP